MSQQNTLTNFSPSWVRSFSRIINDWKFMCIDRTFVDSNHNIRVFGLPYLNHNLGVHEILQSLVSNIDNTKTNILLTHMDLPGLMDTDGREVNTFESPDIKEETLYELFGKFDLVLNGHIHLPQKKEPNILTIGAPLQMRKSDSDAELGYWVIYREHQEFKELNLPKFKFFKKGETPWTETGEEQHYWIEVNPGAIISDHKSPIITFDNRTKLAKNYCKLKGVDSKRKLNKLIKVLNDEGNI
jgi:DNA repair exonuclease SbcCD nuclease subunit